MGSDRTILVCLILRRSFNPRSRMGSDDSSQVAALPHPGFNPRSRMGSDPFVQPYRDFENKFQPTLPHGERPLYYDENGTFHPVSTHAPAWGATYAPWASYDYTIVSTHAPAWGATSVVITPVSIGRFNPRSRMGSDTSPGCTMMPCCGFQPTLPHGERLNC